MIKKKKKTMRWLWSKQISGRDGNRLVTDETSGYTPGMLLIRIMGSDFRENYAL